jgi:hypothetical protein
MNNASETIPGYAYGAEAVAKSWISLQELEQLKISVGFTAEDERYLRLAGEVLGDQTKQIVEHWRSGIIAGIPHLARHSRSPEGNPLPNYLAASNQRFQQWILDTCLRPYDQVWLDYQQEIALRHTSAPSPKSLGFRCVQNGSSARREEGASRTSFRLVVVWFASAALKLVRDVTDEQRSSRPIFNATLRAAASWLFFRVARSTVMIR